MRLRCMTDFEQGMVTATGKVNRRAIVEHYKKEIVKAYGNR